MHYQNERNYGCRVSDDWEFRGNKVAIINVNWPDPNEDFLENLETEIAIQINGKLRGTITIDPDLPEDAIKEKAKEVVDFLNLKHHSNELAGNLSSGQKKILEKV